MLGGVLESRDGVLRDPWRCYRCLDERSAAGQLRPDWVGHSKHRRPAQRRQLRAFAAVLCAFQTKSGSSPKAPSSALISSSLGRWLNRSAASITFGKIWMSPTVLRKTPSRPSTQLTTVSMAAWSVSGSYQVLAVGF